MATTGPYREPPQPQRTPGEGGPKAGSPNPGSPVNIPTMRKGGKMRKRGVAKLHKGERITGRKTKRGKSKGRGSRR